MPQYPYVESPIPNMTAMYYGNSRPERAEGKHDIDSESYLLAETLHQVAVLGGSRKDIIDTALLAAAHRVINVMRLSSAASILESVAEAHEVPVDETFARYLLDRVEITLTGMAYVGACRSIAFLLSHPPCDFRVEVMGLARAEHRRVCGRTGYASLVADDAHAHLWAAENLIIPDEPQIRNQRIEAAQLYSRVGCRLLAMAFAMASGEAWNPFVENRLSAELKEHSKVLDRLAEFSPSERADLDLAYQELSTHWSKATSTWQDLLVEGSYDIDAYFIVRVNTPSQLADPSPTVVALRESEREFRRML